MLSALMMLTRFRRISHTIYGLLRQQQCSLDKIGRREGLPSNIFDMTIINQSGTQSLPSLIKAQLVESPPVPQQLTQIISRPTKTVPWMVRFDRWGFSAQAVVLPKGKGKAYQAAVHISLLGRTYTVRLDVSWPDLSFDRMLHVQNIIPVDAPMTMACKQGDFENARKLLLSGDARGSDVTVGGWPMLDVSTSFAHSSPHC